MGAIVVGVIVGLFVIIVSMGAVVHDFRRGRARIEPPVLMQTSPATWAQFDANMAKMHDYTLQLREEQHTTRQMFGHGDDDVRGERFNVVSLQMARARKRS